MAGQLTKPALKEVKFVMKGTHAAPLFTVVPCRCESLSAKETPSHILLRHILGYPLSNNLFTNLSRLSKSAIGDHVTDQPGLDEPFKNMGCVERRARKM
jgi:hypothetical protein